MGQKVNPIGLRLGVNRSWDSIWFDEKNFADKINEDIKSSMIEKNVDKLAALRAVKSAFLLEMSKDGSTSVSDTTAQSIISKLVKQRKDSYDIYIQKDRVDLATDEMNQISYLNDYCMMIFL